MKGICTCDTFEVLRRRWPSEGVTVCFARDKLSNERIDKMLIPGTHNSGAYDTSKLATIVQNYVLNQDRFVWAQLVFGIRYLDLRVGYYKNEGFYVNHDLIRITPLVPVLRQIRKFAEMAPNEVVLVDFHRFPYPVDFSQELHEQLLEIVYEELGQFAVERSSYAGSGPTFRELWEQNKTLIISYAERNIAQGERKAAQKVS